jgi:hypothetical protein
LPEHGERQKAVPLVFSTVWTSLCMKLHIGCTLLGERGFVDITLVHEDVVQLLYLADILGRIEKGGPFQGSFQP